MTKHFYLLFLFVIPLTLSPITINAQKLNKYQKRLEEQRQENWPPERTWVMPCRIFLKGIVNIVDLKHFQESATIYHLIFLNFWGAANCEQM